MSTSASNVRGRGQHPERSASHDYVFGARLAPYSKGKYDKAQRDAEHAGRGIWEGSYVEPWLFRACIRQGGRPGDCSDDATCIRKSTWQKIVIRDRRLYSYL
jgi:hypothetical protein